jgi:hypothetical protein
VVDVFRVVEMIPIEAGFLSRIKGSVDAGYDFTQASSATTWSASANLEHRTPVWETDVSASSNIKEQTGAENVNRQELKAQLSRYFEDRWFAAILGQGEKNESQGLDLRSLVGGGVGRNVLQTNRTRISVVGGAAYSREKYEDRTDYDSNAEIVGALGFETFRFDHPELDLSAGFVVLPNLLTKGRYRIQANGKARIEILRDFYWSLTVYETYAASTDGLARNGLESTLHRLVVQPSSAAASRAAPRPMAAPATPARKPAGTSTPWW